MKVDIQYRPSNTAAKITLEPGQSCTTEAGSMIAMGPGFDVETTTHKKGKGSLLKSFKRMFTGESFFLNHYTANQTSDLWISSTLSGDLFAYDLNGTKLIVQSGSFLAADENVNIDAGWQGFKSMFSGEGLFWLTASGQGSLVMSSFGCIYEIDVDGEYVVDTGHIVAFEETMDFKISKAGTSWFSSFLGGEGLVCRFKGKGKLFCQSHSPSSFGHNLTPHLRPRRQ